MVFSSYFFLIFFLPLSLLIFFIAAKFSKKLGVLALLLMSLLFYSWNTPIYIVLLIGSMIINFFLAWTLVTFNKFKKSILFLNIIINLSLIFIFKYYNFFIVNINQLVGFHFSLLNIILPIGISFFTFQQIAFIVSIYRKTEELPNFFEYCTFISFFPQLIAGPIVKHSDYLPQLKSYFTFKFSAKNLAIGTTIFIIGLYKKVIIADNAGIVVDRIFSFLGDGTIVCFKDAWLGLICYSFQIYFDFSGYSDMAIGLSRMFNIKLPCNFLSPYKATSVINFWRRWHISLSSFLKEHIYIPLGGNKKGHILRFSNLMITMLIAGLWHGASWNFVIWGGLHGLFLLFNHIFRLIREERDYGVVFNFMKRIFTFIIVTFAWVFFRAENVNQAFSMINSLFGVCDPNKFIPTVTILGIKYRSLLHAEILKKAICICFACTIIVFFFPNVYEWLSYFKPAKNYIRPEYIKKKWFKKICWKPTIIFGLILLILLTTAFGGIDAKKVFIYFQF